MILVFICMCICVCLCVRVRGKDRQTNRDTEIYERVNTSIDVYLLEMVIAFGILETVNTPART